MSDSPSQRNSRGSNQSQNSVHSSDRQSSSDDETPSRSSSMPSGKSMTSTKQRDHMSFLLGKAPRTAPPSSKEKSDDDLWNIPPAHKPRTTVLPVDLYPKVSGPDRTAEPRERSVPLPRYAHTPGTIPEDAEVSSEPPTPLLSVAEARQLQRGKFPPRDSSVTRPVRKTTQPSSWSRPSTRSTRDASSTSSPGSPSRNRTTEAPTGRTWPAKTPAAFSELVEALDGTLPEKRRDKIYNLND